MKNPYSEATLSALREILRMWRSTCEDAFFLHEVYFDCSLDHWHWYMREMGERLMKKNGLTSVSNREKQSLSRVSYEYESCVSRLMLDRCLCLSRKDLSIFPTPTSSFTLSRTSSALAFLGVCLYRNRAHLRTLNTSRRHLNWARTEPDSSWGCSGTDSINECL